MLESYKNKNNLLDVNWYLSKMSMFLKESHGIVDEVNWDIDLLNNMNDVCDSIMHSFDIYSVDFPIMTDDDGSIIDSYEDLMISIDKKNQDKAEEEKIYYKPLDIIASLVGVSRTVKFIVNEEIFWRTLSNYELWQYILIAIARNNFKGTYEQIRDVYKRIGLNILYITTGVMSCKICVEDNDTLSQNIKNLLQQGDILIKSVGVDYNVIFYRTDNQGFALDAFNNLDNFSYILR